MAFWNNPFEGPPPIARAPLPGEDPLKPLNEAKYVENSDVDAPPAERLALQARYRVLPLAFTGTAKEYFRLWVTCQVLTFVTLGFYAPWAKVRKTRYMARHTLLDGVPFDYRANPAAIFRGRLLAYSMLITGALLSLWQPRLVPIFIVVAFACLPWLLTHSFGFKWRTLFYRNIQFNFESDIKPIRWSVWLIGLATAAGVGWSLFSPGSGVSRNLSFLVFVLIISIVAWPYVTSSLVHHRFTNARWGGAAFRLNASVKDIIKMMWKSGKTFMFSIAFIYSLFNGLSFLIPNLDIRSLMQALAYLLMMVCAVAFGRTRRINFVLNRLSVHDRLHISSTLNPDAAARRAAGYALVGIFSLGLLLPWAVIHYAKWRASQLTLTLDGNWSDFPNAPPKIVRGAAADALAEQFDIELGL